MFCKNCGNEIADGNIFCNICGTKVEANESAATTQPNDNQTNNQYYTNDSGTPAYNSDPPQPPKKKKKIGKIIGVVCGVAIVGLGATAGVFAATGKLSNFIHKNFSSPESYFQYVAKENADTGLTAFTDAYDTCVESLNSSTTSLNGNCTIKASVGDSLKPLIGILSSELTDLDNVALEINTSTDDTVQNMQLLASINDQDIATINASMDIKNETGYIQIPELSDSYIDFSEGISEMKDELDSYDEDYINSIGKLQEAMPDSKTLSDILTTYTDIVYDNIDDVEKSTETIKAKGVEQSCTALKADLDGKYYYQVSVDLLETLSDDDNINDIIKSIDEDTYKEFKDSIEESIDEIKDNKDKFTEMDMDMSLTLYVNNKGEIIGENISADYEGEAFEVSCLMPKKGSDFGYVLSVEVSGTSMFEFEGKGTIKKDVLNGKFTLNVNDDLLSSVNDIISSGDEILVMEVSDFNTKEAKTGKLNGSFKLSSEAIAALSSYQLKINVSSDDDEAALELAVVSDEEEWGKVTISAGKGKKLDTVKPSKNDKVYSVADEDDLDEFIESIDIDSFIDSVSDASGIDFTSESFEDLLEMFGYGYESSDYYDWDEDSYYDDYDYDDDYYREDEDGNYYRDEWYEDDSDDTTEDDSEYDSYHYWDSSDDGSTIDGSSYDYNSLF